MPCENEIPCCGRLINRRWCQAQQALVPEPKMLFGMPKMLLGIPNMLLGMPKMSRGIPNILLAN